LGEGSILIETPSGDLLGMTDVRSGTNTDIRVPFDGPAPAQNLVAKLVVDGVVVDESRIFVKR